MSHKKILIIDDVSFHQEFEKEVLISLQKDYMIDFDVDTATTLQEAKSKINQNSYDIIVSDIKLQDGLGSELIPVIKDRDENTKIVALTIYPNKYKDISKDFDIFLHKPITPKEYKDAIISLLKL